MRCLKPINIKTEYNERQVPCGRCLHCLSNYRNQWTCRLMEEEKHSLSSYFITLTYEDDMFNIPIIQIKRSTGEITTTLRNNGVTKVEMQLFIKRLRKLLDKHIKYYIVGEYGEKTRRPHYHMLFFSKKHYDWDKMFDVILRAWSIGDKVIGQFKIDDVEQGSIHYVTKYHITRGCYPYGRNPSFVMMSRRPPIGSDYYENYSIKKYHNEDDIKHYGYSCNGIKTTLPRLYNNKLYCQEVRDDFNFKLKLEEIKKIANKVDKESKDKERLKRIYKKYSDEQYLLYSYDNLAAKLNQLKRITKTEKL